MGLISYIGGIPDAPNNPSFDQPSMKLNNDAIPIYLAVDHVGYNVNESGYHKIIHQRGIAEPAPIADIGQLFVKNVTYNATTDTQLFFKTGLGGLSQLTGGFTTSEGWQFIGGILLQWGTISQVFVTNTTISGTVNFAGRSVGGISFPTACFIVNATFTRGAVNVSQAANTVVIVAKSATSFDWQVRVETSQLNGFYWFAIGN